MKRTKTITLMAALLCCTPTSPEVSAILSSALGQVKHLWTNKTLRKWIFWPFIYVTLAGVSWKFCTWFFRDPINLKLVHMQAKVYQLRKKLPPEAKSKLLTKIREIQISRNQSEFAELETFFRAIMRFPWETFKAPQKNLDVVKKTLDACIFGLNEPKECVLDALYSYHQGFLTGFPPICLVGPPGVGKTAFATALAKALDLPQLIISAAGMDDPESYFRGFSKTYVGSKPGFFVTMFASCECINPVVVIDEIDKQAKGNSKGTAQNVLLQVLDPMQNKVFRDKYLDLPIDVSNAFYILTANDIENIIEPLQDRMFIIHIPNYSKEEIEEMAYGMIWHAIAGSKLIPPAMKAQMIKTVFTRLKKEPSIRSIKKNLSCEVIRWLRLNHKKNSMVW